MNGLFYIVLHKSVEHGFFKADCCENGSLVSASRDSLPKTWKFCHHLAVLSFVEPQYILKNNANQTVSITINFHCIDQKKMYIYICSKYLLLFSSHADLEWHEWWVDDDRIRFFGVNRPIESELQKRPWVSLEGHLEGRSSYFCPCSMSIIWKHLAGNLVVAF